MKYKQIYEYEPSPYQGGWCLKMVTDCLGFIDDPNLVAVSCANEALNMEKITGRLKHDGFPDNCAVPIWFKAGGSDNLDLARYGHIAIRLPDGRVASASQDGYHDTPYIHDSIGDLINYYNCGMSYAGWSTHCTGVEIVESISEIKDIKDYKIMFLKDYGNNRIYCIDNKVTYCDDNMVNVYKDTHCIPRQQKIVASVDYKTIAVFSRAKGYVGTDEQLRDRLNGLYLYGVL